MYKPLYLPYDPDGEEKTDGLWFATEDEAWDYVYSRMCSRCREERARALAGVGTDRDSAHPACACEWSVETRAEHEEWLLIDAFAAGKEPESIKGESGTSHYLGECPKCKNGVMWLYHDAVFYLRCCNCDFRDDVVPQ